MWSNDFSDNDAGVKSGLFLQSADDPSITDAYSYGCCLNVLPEPYRSRAILYPAQGSTNGVWATYVHTAEDTSFSGAASTCSSFGSDVCSKSQYVTLRDNSVFTAATRLWSNEMSDNDAATFNAVVGATGDNPGWTNYFAYACCGSQRPLDNSCPAPAQSVGGVCVVSVHDVADASFFTAARACAAQNADICTKSQMTILRNQLRFSAAGTCWSNGGGDNDSLRVGGLALTNQPDNPDPASTLMGYACCM